MAPGALWVGQVGVRELRDRDGLRLALRCLGALILDLLDRVDAALGLPAVFGDVLSDLGEGLGGVDLCDVAKRDLSLRASAGDAGPGRTGGASRLPSFAAATRQPSPGWSVSQ